MSFAPLARLDHAVASSDYFRRPEPRGSRPPGFKEWFHFCVYGDGVDLLVNFSVVDDVRPGRDGAPELARVTVLVRDDEGWDGDVETFDWRDVDVRAGRIDARFGRCSMAYAEGRYRLRVALTDRAIEANVELRVRSFPAPAYNVEVEDGPPIHWLVIPRLLATGTVRIGTRTHRFSDAPAYHDHNWGWFRWGRDFAWEWGFGLPTDPDHPWSIVFVRLSDRAHSRAMMQALFVWEHSRQRRVFRADAVELNRLGLHRQSELFKLPRPMALLSPGRVTDVPARLSIYAREDGDWCTAEFDAGHGSQVILPNDDDLGVTIINEVSATFRARGVVDGRAFEVAGPSIFEYLGA